MLQQGGALIFLRAWFNSNRSAEMPDRTPYSAIRIFRDGSCIGALLGRDLLEGEVEYVSIKKPGGPDEVRVAAAEAAILLEDRLDIAHLGLPRIIEFRLPGRLKREGIENDDTEDDDVDQWWSLG